MLVVDRDFWRGRRVYLTGQTGFKGAWLALWLQDIGAVVAGRALPPRAGPSLFSLARLDEELSAFGDVADSEGVHADMTKFQPEIVIHLAAQALVRQSYHEPIDTFRTNVMGTAAVCDASRRCGSVRALVSVTSDKCYENREWAWGYRESDRLGGHDPYSASKGAAEIVTAAMRSSYFGPGGHPGLIASVRAGNVIGGGDWAQDRLVPDIVRGCLSEDGAIRLRNPTAVRPWQHVLEPISAYLGLAQRLYGGDAACARAFNFGPQDSDARTVAELADALVGALGASRVEHVLETKPLHEARLLRLDCSLAREVLGWRPRLDFHDTIAWTASWYGAWHAGQEMRAFTLSQIAEFEQRAHPL